MKVFWCGSWTMWITGTFLVIAAVLSLGSSNAQSGPSEFRSTLTAQERQWLDEHPIIRVAPDPDAAPIESFDKNGNFVGISAEFIELIEERLGIKFEIIELPNWGDVLTAAKQRQIDVYTATKTEERSQYMSFTSPHIELPGVLIVSNNDAAGSQLEDFNGKKIAVVAGHVWQEWIARDFPEIDLDPQRDLRAALSHVAFGQAQAMVTDLAAASHFIAKEGITNLRVAGETGYYARLSLGVRSDWPEFTTILEKVLETISPEQREQIIAHSISLNVIEGTSWSEVLVVVAPIGISFLIIIVIIIFTNRRLKVEVVERTMAEKAAQDARKNAEDATKLKDKFVALIAHDLINPVGAIRGLSELLLTDTANPLNESQRESVQYVDSQSQEILTLISKVLDISRLQSGKIVPNKTFFDARKLTEELVQRVTPMARAKDIELINEVPADRRLFADRVLLGQVIQNLLTNAVKFSKAGSQVRIVPQEGQSTNIAVIDTGIGIPKEKHNKLFDMEEKTSTLGTRGETGTGFGLPMSQQIMQAHGGKLQIESSEDHGSTFIIDLPEE